MRHFTPARARSLSQCLGSTVLRLVLPSAIGLAACKPQAAVDPAEVQRLVESAMRQQRAGAATPGPDAGGAAREARPRSREGAPSRRTEGGSGADDQSEVVVPGCLSAAGAQNVQSTARLLIELDALMDGFVAPQPQIPAEAPESCLTAIGAQNDPMALRIERGLAREYAERRRIARAAAEEARTTFLQTVRPTAWTWLRVWIEGQPFTLVPAVNGCRDDYGSWTGRSRGDCDCYNCVWAQRRPAVVASAEPELTRRVRTSGTLHPEQDIYCSVQQAVMAGEIAQLTCQGPRNGQSFYINVPATSAAEAAPLGHVGVGDLVRVQGHLVITKAFQRSGGEDVGVWVVRDIPAESVSVVERSTCCSPQAGDAGVAAGDAQ